MGITICVSQETRHIMALKYLALFALLKLHSLVLTPMPLWQHVEMRDNTQGKGKDKGSSEEEECPSVEEIAYYAMDMFSDELCWMMEMNWLDMEYNFNETKYAEDVMELPATVSAALLDEEAFNQCQQEALAMMASEYDNGCSEEYTEEELENLEEIGELASGIMCLKKTFDESCADYIENELIYMIQAASSMNLAGK